MTPEQIENNSNAKRFAMDLLKLLKISPGKNNVNFILAWQAAENSEHKFNPLGDTLKYNGSTGSFVQSYKSYQDGLTATYKTLTSGLYPYIVYYIKNDLHADYSNGLIDNLNTWGTRSLMVSTYNDRFKGAAIQQAGFGSSYLLPIALAAVATWLFKK